MVRVFFASIGITGITIAILVIYIITNGKIPTNDPSWLYSDINKFEFQSNIKADKLIGGGHFFVFDGRDLWMRFHEVRSPGSSNELEQLYGAKSYAKPCNDRELEEIRAWFFSRLSHRNFLSYLTSSSELEREDKQSLNDVNNLKCFIAGDIPNNFGDFPSNAGTWWLYNQRTRFHYFRYASYN